MSYWFSADPEEGKLYACFTDAAGQLIGSFLELMSPEDLARLEIELKNVLDGHFWEVYYVEELIRFNADQVTTRIRCNFPGQNKTEFYDTDYIHQILAEYNARYDAEFGRVRPPYRYEDDTWDREDPWVRRRKKLRV
ncbi:MAG: hypothetical protein IJ375_02860 [Oscillospiraceae bacterium]|nr:hypothetical protein [Oscillospiraceae bacterium]